MPQPFDYSSGFASLQQPQDAMMAGLKNGVGIQQMQMERQAAQAKAQQAQAMQTDLAALSQNPTTQGIIAATIKYPQLSEQFKRSFDMLDPAEQRTRLERAMPVFTALHSNQPDIAAKLLKEQAVSLRNSGKEEEAKAAETKAQQITENPAAAKFALGGLLAAAIGPDKFAKMMGDVGTEQRAQELQPAAVREATGKANKATSDAQTAGVQAKYAEKNVLQDYEKKGWDIKKIQADIANDRESNRIKAMEAATAREGNSLKREELRMKIDEAKRAHSEKIAERVAQAETEIAGVTDTKDLINEILKDKDSLRAVTGASAWKGSIPGTENRSMAGKIEQLVNMAAAMNLDKLKGPMSDKDILFVKRISANLDRYQDEDLFEADMRKFLSITERTEKKLRDKYGAPAPNKPTFDAAAAKKPSAEGGNVIEFGSLR